MKLNNDIDDEQRSRVIYLQIMLLLRTHRGFSHFLKIFYRSATCLSTSVDGQAPRVAAPFLTWAEIVILQNDDPHGVVELSVSERTVFENFTGPLVSLVRRKGIFGEVRSAYLGEGRIRCCGPTFPLK